MSAVNARNKISRTGLPCPGNSIVVRTTIKQTSLFIACYTSAMVNQTSAHTKTYRTAGDLAGNQIHNARAWTDTHRAPGYLLRPEHVDPRGNEHVTPALTPRAVIDEYLATNEFGKKHGRVHHKARPLREAVIVCQESTTKRDMSRLMKVLEKDLGVRTMYGHLHRDEGRIDKKTGKVKRNYHIHFGYTNLVDGELVHMDQKKMQRMQDTCAKVLKMQRGDPAAVTKRKHLEHGAYRVLAIEQEKTQAITAEATTAREQAGSATTQAENAQQEKENLVKANRELRQRLKDSGQARQEDYQQVKRFMTDSTLSETERVKAATAYVDERTAHSPPPTVEALTDLDTPLQAADHVSANPPRPLAPVITNLVEANRELRQRLKDSGQARQEDYQQVKRFMTDSTLSKTERVKAATAYVEERTAHSPPPKVKDLVDLSKEVSEPIRYLNATATLKPVIEELVREKEKRQQAEIAAGAANRRVEAVEKALPETGWTMPRVKTRKETSIFRPDQRVENEKASQYRHRVGQEIDLYLAKQRKADLQALEEEEKQVREQATADGKANVQQEIQLSIDRAIEADSRAAKAKTRAENAESALEKLKERCKVFLDALESLPEKMRNYFTSLMGSSAEVTRDHFAEQATPQIPVQQKIQDPQDWDAGDD